MAELQTTYSNTIAAAYAGMIANGETGNRITRTCETAAGIGFGKAVYRGANDHGCLLAQTLAGAGSEAAGNVGTGTITATPTISAGAKIGRYTVTLLATSATGAFNVTDPDGIVIGTGKIATAFSAGGVAFTWANGDTMTIGDQAYVDVTGNAFLGISIATSGQQILTGQDADEYQQYDNVPILTSGAIWVTAGGTVTDGAAVHVAADGDFDTSGIPLPGWVFDTSGADTNLVKIVKR
ncbi:MAG: hypothetical protein A3E01_09275 [Gammaproteobacteria bacterium RIFCSPHIGHO2_12_FULL_63_22]|nr:MAG: hypothetical protein A3E01_09275 [Gammaproteobacteria bacterium RIFCSPHIGHO2_12_FULL_63_22]